MEYNEQNWKELLEALHFKEHDNVSFGGKEILDDEGIPKWTYDSDNEEWWATCATWVPKSDTPGM